MIRYNAENNVTFADPNAEIAQLTAKLKYSKMPCEAVIEFSKWIREHLTYDDNCNFVGDDITTILTYRRGHCLHFMNILKALCSAAGIQCRDVQGLNLFTPDSDADQAHHAPSGFHICAEIFLPGARLLG